MMGAMARHPFLGIAILGLFLLAGGARAQDADAPEMDPPDRAARLALIRGEVSMQPAGEEDWAPALLNRPLTTGDKLWTERGARAEIQVGHAAVRLGEDTGFSFLNLDDSTIQMRLTAGTLIVDVRELRGNDQIEIDTPNIALSVLRPGSYRVEVNDAGDATTVKISEGEAEAVGPSQNVIVHSRQVVTFRGFEQLAADWGTLGAPDEFDDWSAERESRWDRVASSPSSRYVSPDVTGYDDLDEHGSWSSEPEYGYVWTPRRVASDWSPYRYGRWVWVSPWGYTWIDDAPWGYAPFHYGRWAHIRHRWCWVPGPRHVRAVYAPALVGWVGSGGLHVSWYPLGPRDVYVPGRRFSRHYLERVNIANTLIVNRTHLRDVYDRRGPHPSHRGRSLPGAVTSVPRATFASAGRVGQQRVSFDERQLRNTREPGVAPQVAPGRESRLGGQARVNPRMPAAVATRQVIVKRPPPASAARYARRPVGTHESATAPRESFQPPRDRGARVPGVREAMVRDQQERRDGADRPDRPDRPYRSDRQDRSAPDSPAVQAAPQSSVFDSRAIAERVREDRDRQVRGAQQRHQQEVERQALDRPAEDHEPRRQNQLPERWQRPQDEQRDPQQIRERFQRQQDPERRDVERRDALRQAVERQAEQRDRSAERARAERPQMERPVQRPVERPVERQRSEPPPRQERSHRESSPPPQQQQQQQPRQRENNDPRARGHR
jgi:hypothetical protein